MPHAIHVWYTYRYLPIYRKHQPDVGKCLPYMDSMGLEKFLGVGINVGSCVFSSRVQSGKTTLQLLGCFCEKCRAVFDFKIA